MVYSLRDGCVLERDGEPVLLLAPGRPIAGDLDPAWAEATALAYRVVALLNYHQPKFPQRLVGAKPRGRTRRAVP